jgi:transcriptional regulator with XRE-family HTH domain
MGERKTGAQLLRERLVELDWSQSELAEKIGSSPAVVSRWLAEFRKPTLEMAFRVQAAAGVPAHAWLDDPCATDADETGKHGSLSDEAALKLAATGND